MTPAQTAELQVLLEGVPLPATRRQLLEYGRHEYLRPNQLRALRSLPEQLYPSIDRVAEEILRVQPKRREQTPDPQAVSGAPPGGADYVQPHAESGAVRDKEALV